MDLVHSFPNRRKAPPFPLPPTCIGVRTFFSWGHRIWFFPFSPFFFRSAFWRPFPPPFSPSPLRPVLTPIRGKGIRFFCPMREHPPPQGNSEMVGRRRLIFIRDTFSLPFDSSPNARLHIFYFPPLDPDISAPPPPLHNF